MKARPSKTTMPLHPDVEESRYQAQRNELYECAGAAES